MRHPGGEAGGLYSGRMAQSGILAVGATELSVVLVLLLVVVVPVAAVAFARSGRAYSEIGKGQFAVDFDEGRESVHHEEVRQLVEAKAFRQAQRGEKPVDVDAEVDRLLNPEETGDATEETHLPPHTPDDPELMQIRSEIREVVLAKNESRERRGEPPLDVEAEVDRMLAEFG